MLSDFNKDNVTLVKADGTVAKEQIPALVSGEMIFTADKSLPVEVGDYLLRNLPNGLVEKYEVTNPKYYDVGHGLDAHFQIDVRRAGSPQAQAAVVQGITNNFNGPNSRVNINSTDNSINVSADFSSKQLHDFVEQVRPVLSQLPEDSQQIIEAQLVTIEEEADKPTPTKMRVLSALQSIKSVAEGASGNLVAAGIISLIGALL
ncbi:hypothetical protein K3718_00590 [Leisingera aquaemixtae]|uniref:Uncharacterized protein n=1 Tax=Leisingera aquaemixtae TaxID=1396826 RepID=A0ABY5WJI2_9RHOB|nr:hypothetical protein [Leisingera aquaemixtae]UWQ41618.1 hypothetical protein K3718_00590 [Leisingera aquaemixtae]